MDKPGIHPTLGPRPTEDGRAVNTESEPGVGTESLLGMSDDIVHVLLIEDSPEYAVLVEAMLTDELGEGLEVTTCENLFVAHRHLRDERPECILLDLALPDAVGLQALAEVTRAAPETPIVVLSGQDDESIAVEAVQAGAQDYLVKRQVSGGLLVRAIRYAMERKGAELDLARLAYYDPLTDLPNRRLLMDRLGQLLARAGRTSRPVVVLFVDLDGFKSVNDTYGHEAGDALLAAVAGRLRAQVRADETVARYGGDEFVVLSHGLEDEAGIEALASRIEVALTTPFELGAREIHIGASMGVALAHDSTMSAAELIGAADEGMFRAKDDGALFAVGATRSIGRPHRSGVEEELLRAQAEHEFMLHFQPVVDLRSRRIFAVEALIRWQHPDRGLLPPAEFISAAELSGLIVPIGDWVIGAACSQLREWRDAGLCDEDLTMCVNLSPRQLSDPALVGAVRQHLSRAGVDSESICIEVTESTVASDPAQSTKTLHELRDLGAQIALDDFGVGNSSLGALGDYPVDLLKIDRSFVSPLDTGLKARRVFAAILGVAHAFEIPAVAEGIETPEHLRQLARIGCDAGQGFHLAMPDRPEEIAPKLRSGIPAAG